MACNYCVAELHNLCDEIIALGEDSEYVSCCCYLSEKMGQEQGGEGLLARAKTALAGKDPSALKDVISTGRHRAAVAKPITDGVVCEWAGLKYAGGGVEPIIGCKGTLLYKKRGQYARHHGPDKSVLNNSPENLHLICPVCHNRWHTLNDKYYGDGTGSSRPPAGETWLPNIEWKMHDAETKASAAEIVQNEIWWATHPIDRENIELEEENV